MKNTNRRKTQQKGREKKNTLTGAIGCLAIGSFGRFLDEVLFLGLCQPAAQRESGQFITGNSVVPATSILLVSPEVIVGEGRIGRDGRGRLVVMFVGGGDTC